MRKKFAFWLLLLISTGVVPAAGEDASLKSITDTFPGSLVLTDLEQNDLSELNRMVVNIPSFELYACADNEIIKVYKVSLGRIGLPTPEGIFVIDRKIKNPHYIPLAGSPNKKIADYFPPGENNPMGTRKMHFYGPIYIHGLPQNKRHFVGKTKNGSCVALLKEDIEELFDYVAIGTKVEIHYKVNIVTANDQTLDVRHVPDLYHGYRRITTDPALFPCAIKQYPVHFLAADSLSGRAGKKPLLEQALAADTLLIMK